MKKIKTMMRIPLWILVAAACLVPSRAVASEPLQSPQMARAKDFIADEQWLRAIDILRAAAADAKEKHRDEALFWLAHSQHQARDLAAALKTITDLQTRYPKSPWVKPAASLKIEIAQKLNRRDFLWGVAQPDVAAMPLMPAPPQPGAVPPPPLLPSPRAEVPPPGAVRGEAPRTTPARPVASAAPSAPAANTPRPPAAPTPAPAPFATTLWMPEGWQPDASHRIQALSSLIQTDAPKVIPILKEIALESPDTNEARRAVFVLAQSGKPDAYTSVLEIAREGSETVQIAAVRELGQFGGREVADRLLEVYRIVSPRVKYQVVESLGQRAATTALMRIAETEADKRLKEIAIVRLGQAGARDQLQRYYVRAHEDLKEPIIRALVLAKAEDALIRIAETERDDTIRRQAISGLRLLGSAKARQFIEKQKIEKREQNR